METQVMTGTKYHNINIFHGASGTTIPVDLKKLDGYSGTIEGALRQAISKNVHPGFFATIDSPEIDIELFAAGSEQKQGVERPLSRHEDWSTVLSEAEKCNVELGVARHARGGGNV